jgi:hypothetical protein
MVVCYRKTPIAKWIGLSKIYWWSSTEEAIQPNTSSIITELKEPEYIQRNCQVTYNKACMVQGLLLETLYILETIAGPFFISTAGSSFGFY